jgi:hypothetical protein
LKALLSFVVIELHPAAVKSQQKVAAPIVANSSRIDRNDAQRPALDPVLAEAGIS